MKKLFLGILVGTLSLSASAVTINVSGSCAGGNTTFCNTLEAELENELNADTPDVGIDKYAGGIANATGFAMKGQNSDYAENFNWFVLKPSFGLAVDGEVDDPEGANGFGLGGALTVGINLDLLPVDKIGFIEFDKMDLFVSFMSYNVNNDVGDGGTAEGDLSSFSVMARYQIMEGADIVPGYMVEWGGLHIHTGIQRNSMGINLSQDLADETVDAGGGTTGTFSDGNVTFDMESSVTSIPLELSTYLRLAYVFTLYGGVGFDYNLSSDTDVDLDASGNFSGNDGAGTTYTATISANEKGSGEGAATNFRNFVGIQFNVPFARLYLQMNQGMGSDLMGVNAGLKVTY